MLRLAMLRPVADYHVDQLEASRAVRLPFHVSPCADGAAGEGADVFIPFNDSAGKDFVSGNPERVHR